MRKIMMIMISVLAVSGCLDRQISEVIRKFKSSTITFTDDIFIIKERNVYQYEDHRDKFIMVMLHDSTACSLCHLSHLNDYLHFYEEADSTGLFEIMMLFSPRDEDYANVMEQIEMLNFPYPLYLDFGGSFMESNPDIPADPRFRCFLLDRDRRPVYVGNPCASEELMSVFKKTLESIEK